MEGWNQDRIKAARVLIGGVGALGTVAGLNLTLMGVGEIHLVDMDTIEVSNLNRQLLFHEKDVGKSKAEIAAQALRAVNPEINIVPHVERLENIPLKIYKKCHVLLDGLDDFEPRRWLNSIAISKRIPLVSGGIYGFMGNLQIVMTDDTPCLECQPLLGQEVLSKPCTPPGQERERSDEPDGKIPSVISVSTGIGGLMVQETIKLILGMKDQVLRKYLFWDGLTETFTSIPLEKRSDCEVCSSRFRLEGIPIIGEPSETYHEFLERVKVTFLLKNPTLMLRMKTVTNDQNRELKDIFQEGDKIFLIDKAIPEPKKLHFSFSS
ncbi:MAG: ThiF family adenylyltransferase [Promethearchaeota archaeon]